MICTHCGQNNGDDNKTCASCGLPLEASAVPPAASSSSEPEIPDMGRQPVLLTLLISVVTLGIYQSIWFVLKAPKLNKLNAGARVNPAMAIVGLVLNLVGDALSVLSIVAMFSNPLSGGNSMLQLVSNLSSLAGSIIILVQAFAVRSILNEHWRNAYARELEVSGLGTFFLSVYYLQYKINRLMDGE